MIIRVKVHPNSSREEVVKIDDNDFEVYLKEKPEKGRANIKLLKVLKKYFKKQVEIKSGYTSTRKMIDILYH